MNSKDHPTHRVKKVVLPNGKSIDVVCLDDGKTTTQFRERDTKDLHICPICDSHLVYPTYWEEVGDRHWHVEVRCPNCEWIASGIFSQPAVDRFDEELDRGTKALIEDVRRLCRAAMEEDVERFCAALEQDNILPMDF